MAPSPYPSRGSSSRSLHPLLEVSHELADRFVGLRVAQHRAEELGGHRHDVGAGLEGLADVGDVADAAHDDLAREAPLPEGGPHLAHHRGRVVADVPDAAVEEADEV